MNAGVHEEKNSFRNIWHIFHFNAPWPPEIRTGSKSNSYIFGNGYPMLDTSTLVDEGGG